MPAVAPSKDPIPIDDHDQAIVNLSARINAETYELLILIRQFDDACRSKALNASVATAIKRALQARDRRCWSAGGETKLDNLMLLCSQHHKRVHEGEFTIQRDYQNQWFFKRPDGRAGPACREPPPPAYWH